MVKKKSLGNCSGQAKLDETSIDEPVHETSNTPCTANTIVNMLLVKRINADEWYFSLNLMNLDNACVPF